MEKEIIDLQLEPAICKQCNGDLTPLLSSIDAKYTEMYCNKCNKSYGVTLASHNMLISKMRQFRRKK